MVSVDTPLPTSNLALGEVNRGGDGNEGGSYEHGKLDQVYGLHAKKGEHCMDRPDGRRTLKQSSHYSFAASGFAIKYICTAGTLLVTVR